MMDTSPPASLPARYRDTWRSIILDLRAAGTLNRATPTTVQALAVATHQWQEATDLIEQTGTIYNDNGVPRTSPALQVQTTTATTIARLSRQLGLNRGTHADQAESRDAAPVARRQQAHPMRESPPMQEGDPARWCDQHKRRECVHQRSRGRGTCHGTAITGLDSCRMHAGSQVRVAVAKSQRQRGHWQPIPVHPAEALLGEVAWWAGQSAWLDEVVGGLQEGEMVWGMVRRQDVQGGEFPGATVIEEATLNTWIGWQQKSHGQLAQVSRWALEAAAEDRMVRLAEAQGARAFSAFQMGLRRLELTAAQWEAAREVMPAVLKELTAA